MVLCVCFMSCSFEALYGAPVSPQKTQNPTANSSKKALTPSQLYLKAREFFAAGRYTEAIQYAAASQRSD
jgi:hypothetical protein